jgi:O-antigen/teichoic acid export membrane protein
LLREAAQLTIFVLRGELRVGETAVIKVVRQATWVIIGVLFTGHGFGAIGLIYAFLLSQLCSLILGLQKISIKFGYPSIEHAQSLLEFGKYNAVSSIGGYFYSWMDILIIGIFLTQAHVGAYEVAWKITMVVMLLSNAISTTLFPHISQWDHQDAHSGIETLIPKSIFPPLLIVIPIFFGTLVLSQEILRILFGAEFVFAWLVLIILTGEKIIQSIHVVLGKTLQGIDKPDLAAIATVISIVLNLVLNVILVWKFGIIGAAIATSASFVVNALLHAKYLSNYISIKLPTHKIIWSTLSAIAMTVVILPLKSIIGMNTIFSLLGIIIIGGVCYAMLVLLYPPIRSDAREAFMVIKPT